MRRYVRWPSFGPAGSNLLLPFTIGRGAKHDCRPVSSTGAPSGPHSIPMNYFSCPPTHASRRLPLLVIWRPIRKIPLSRKMGKQSAADLPTLVVENSLRV